MLHFLIQEILLLKREKRRGGGGCGGKRKQLKLSYLCVFCEYLLTMAGNTSHLISLDELYIFSTMYICAKCMEYFLHESMKFLSATSSYAFYYVSWELLHITLCCDLAMACSFMKADFCNQFILWKKASLKIYVFCCTDFVFASLFFLGIISCLLI